MNRNLILVLVLPVLITGVYFLAGESLRNKDNVSQVTSESKELNKATNQATLAVSLGKSAKTKNQWQTVAKNWEQAIAQMNAIPPDSADYDLAQTKIVEYQGYLNLVRERAKTASSTMTLVKTIHGDISPKSVVHSGSGLFFAQNMMYNHTITVYDRAYNLVKTITDKVNLSDYGHKEFQGTHQGSPVEASFSHDGKYAWVSNYQMYGSRFNRPGSDVCHPSGNYDSSYLYRINTDNLETEQVIRVGSVPKFTATSPDNRFVLVSNWCSYDLSIIDTQSNQEIQRLKLGRYPRGIAIDANSEKAYVAIMGSTDIAVISLKEQKRFALGWLRNIGASPRHLNIAPTGDYLYATLNGEGNIAKIDLSTNKVISKVRTGNAPRSMAISDDGEFLYVVNYHSSTVSKVRTQDMKVIQSVQTGANPIGITYDSETHQVWVACYSGSLMVFQV
ncbi:MAG: YncE family protein [Nostocales cyanobacterium 94392]|nr:YncE family protein [Nostocales cyanobacterium 94392]